MSQGALTAKDGGYFSIESQRNAGAEDFEREIWISRTPLLTDVLGITDEGYREINKIIGRFIEAIQKISFVRQDVLDAFRHERRGHLFDNLDDPCCLNTPILEVSTLPVGMLVATMRKQIADVIADILRHIPRAASVLGDTMDKKPASEEKKPEIRNEVLSIGESVTDNGELAYMDLLTAEAREMLDKFGPDYAKVVNEMLISLTQTILTRAELSFPSFLGDADRIRRDKRDDKKDMDKEAKYSTLDPFNLIRHASQILYNLPFGILFRLPRETQKLVFDRLEELKSGKQV